MPAGFEQMRGPRVAQRVHRGALVEAAFLESGAQGVLHPVARHGGGGRGHPAPATARGRKKPHRMAVGFAVRAEQREGLLGQRHLAIVRPFAITYVDDHPGTVNIGNLQVGAFLQPQATGIDGAQAGAIAW